ncbi:MAG: metallophosphoesterase [Gemmataceae bacterium]|nr:metallophosphoesterase [Gemmataceae bacterium]
MAQSIVQFLQALEHALPAWLLLIGAILGHAYLMTIGLNVLYAWPLPHRILKYTRKIDMLIILLGPALFFYALDFGGTQQLTWTRGSLRFWLAPYCISCAIAGLVIAPLAQLFYWLRRQAPQLVETKSTTVDVAKALGYKPAGRGKQRSLALLPGNQCFEVDFTEKTLALPQLPAAWDKLTILHLTDLHLCGSPDLAFFQYVMDRCLSWHTPDLVALTGDVVDSSWHHRWIVPVLGKLRWTIGAFAILGNHDAWRDTGLIRRRLRRMRFDVLGNSWRQIDVRGEPLIVIGNETPWFKPAPDLSICPNVAGTLRVPSADDGTRSVPTTFHLLLSHTPDTIAWARKHHVDLMLAGHVHGGQIRLPLIGSMFVPSRYSRRYDQGTFFEAPTVMHVGRGLSGQHPLRYFCRPEVTLLTLRKASKPHAAG